MTIWATGDYMREISFVQSKITDHYTVTPSTIREKSVHAHTGYVPKWEMSKSLFQLLQVVSTSSDSSSDLSDCVSMSCSGCLWTSIVRTRTFTIRLLSIYNFARPLRNIFNPAGSGISELYGKTVYCKRSTIFVPHIFCPLYTIYPRRFHVRISVDVRMQ
jgi:hypothetical protein